MIEKIKVTDVTVVGSIREAMPTATRQAKGLMPVVTEKNPYQQYIQLEKDLEMEFDYSYGMVSLFKKDIPQLYFLERIFLKSFLK